MAQMRDYRQNQFQKDWWDEKLFWWGGMTRGDMVWVVVGFIFAVLCFKFPISWDWVFGLRHK